MKHTTTGKMKRRTGHTLRSNELNTTAPVWLEIEGNDTASTIAEQSPFQLHQVVTASGLDFG
jgi:hypothetical protein